VKRSSFKHVAEATGISRGHVTRVVKGAALNTAVDRDRVLNALRRMNAGESHGSKR
jgi:DNA-binding LacI/PurR family transcriptional regulator